MSVNDTRQSDEFVTVSNYYSINSQCNTLTTFGDLQAKNDGYILNTCITSSAEYYSNNLDTHQYNSYMITLYDSNAVNIEHYNDTECMGNMATSVTNYSVNYDTCFVNNTTSDLDYTSLMAVYKYNASSAVLSVTSTIQRIKTIKIIQKVVAINLHDSYMNNYLNCVIIAVITVLLL